MNDMVLDSIRYSVPYIFLIGYFILLFILENIVNKQDLKKNSNKLIIQLAAGTGLLLFFGFRGFVGWDWTIYYPTFQNVQSLFQLDKTSFAETRYEPAFVIWISVFKLFSGNYHFFVFINTFIDIIILLAFFRQFSKENYALSCLMFIVMGGFYLETDLLRNAKSIMLFLLSLKYLRDRRIITYIVLNILGCMFHFSSLLYIPLYFVLHKQWSRTLIFFIFLIGIAIYLLQVEYIRPFIIWVANLMGEKPLEIVNKYLSNDLYSSEYGLSIGFIERVFTCLMILIFYTKLIKRSKDNIIFINSYVLFFVFFFYFAEVRIIPVRVAGLFYFSYWILYPELLSVIRLRNNRVLFLVFIFVYSFAKIISMTDTILYKYKSVLFRKEIYEERLKIFESTKDYFLR